MLRKLIRIIQKDFKLLLRSKSSALIVILGPLVLIALVGLAFSNTQPYAIDISVYSSQYTNLTQSLLDKLDESQFKVTKFDNNNSCIDSVKFGDSSICVIFPPDLDVKSETSNNITFHVDYSKINLVWMVLDVISSKIHARSSEISMDLTSDILERLKYTESELDKNIPIVVELASKNDDITKKVTVINNNLNSLDLSIDLDDFQVEYLEGKVETLMAKGTEAVAEADSVLDQIESEIDDLNITNSEESALQSVIDESRTNLAGINSNLNSVYSGNGSVGISKLMSELDKNLKDVASKLSKATSTRKSVNSDVDSVVGSLATSLDRLNQLQTSLNSINQNLGALQVTQAAKIVNPITTTIMPVSTKKTHFNLLFPTLIVLIIMITGVLLGSTLIIVEKKSKSFFRNYITPTNDMIFTIGTYLTALIIMVSQAIIFLSISSYFFKTEIIKSIHITGIIMFFVITFFVFLGMFIGSIFKSEETTTLAAITCCSILLFFSSTILPLESMPSYFRNIAALNPFVVSESLLKQSIFFGFSLGVIRNELIVMGLSIVLIIGLTILIQKILKIQILFGIHKEDKLKTRKQAEQLVVQERKEEKKISVDQKMDEIQKELEKL